MEDALEISFRTKEMATAKYPYNPDYATPPGWVLEEYLEVRGISQAEFARRCGRSAKLISEILSGKAPIEPETAMQFERVLGLKAQIWLNMEAEYQLRKAYKKESDQAARKTEWVEKFPISEMVRRSLFQKPESPTDAMSKLLTFFGVGTADAWDSRYELGNVAYRQSPAFESEKMAVATWLRLGECEGEQQDCADYDESQFKRTVQKEVRKLTCQPINEAFKRTTELCNKAGVALVATPPFKRMALSGAAWWMSPKRPIIQMSLRYKTNDHFWFTLFHEAAHILLHSKKTIFLDDKNNDRTDIEKEADEWAANTLIPKKAWNRFVAEFQKDAREVQDFAKQQGIAPGIVVGRLQHEGGLSWGSSLNHLKERYEWKSDDATA